MYCVEQYDESECNVCVCVNVSFIDVLVITCFKTEKGEIKVLENYLHGML